MRESRANYLIKNTAILAIGNMASKLITFFLVPLYTNSLTTSEYGIVDVVSTLCYVLAPILILNISESVMRFSLDKNADYSKILSIGVVTLLIGMVIGLVIIPIANNISSISNYSLYVYLFIVTNAVSQLFLYYLRGRELIAQYTIGNVLHTFTIAIFNIVFLVVLKKGMIGYFWAYILSSFITAIYAMLAGNVLSISNKFAIDKKLFYQMLKYSVVLIPNTFMWWIMNSSDRLMVAGMVGTDENGIYAISYKFPTLVSTITLVFNQAWSYSAIREAGTNDESNYNNSILKKLCCFVIFLGTTIITFSKMILRVYVAPDYYSAWRYMPFLTIGCVFLTLATFMGTAYTVHKDSFGYLASGMFGAVLNIALNFLLIPRIKVYGAAIATCVSYFAVFCFRLFHTRKYITFRFTFKEFIIGMILMISCSGLLFWNSIYGTFLQLFLLLFILVIYVPVFYPYFLKWWNSHCKGTANDD